MGVESKLKTRETSTRYTYSNGDRKFYDKNACPDGCDSDVWDLTLRFRQGAERHGWTVEDRPIVYTELYDRIFSDKDLTTLLRPGTIGTTGNGGRGGTTTVNNDDSLIILEEMIDYYYHNYSSNRKPSVNDFCSIETFMMLKTIIMNKRKLHVLYSTAVKVVSQVPEAAASRRTDTGNLYVTVRNRDPLPEDVLAAKFDDFRRNNECR